MDYGLILDIVLLCLLIICVNAGIRAGFVKSVAVLTAVALSMGAAWFVSSRLTPYVSRSVVSPLIDHGIDRLFEKRFSADTIESLDSVIETGTNAIDKLIDKIKGGDDAEGGTSDETTGTDAETDDESSESTPVWKLSSFIGQIITMLILFILFFAAALTALRILVDKLDFINRIPVFGPINRFAGAVIGMMCGIAILKIPIYIMSTMLPKLLGGISIIDTQTFSGSWILNFIMEKL